MSNPRNILDEGVEIETDLQWRQNILKEFKVQKSQASCKLNDIDSFVYGPFTSRFWLLRKYINMLDTEKLSSDDNVPFHAWNCITLSIRGERDVYLVIKNEKIMTKFLKLLLYTMKTVDGTKNSAKKLI